MHVNFRNLFLRAGNGSAWPWSARAAKFGLVETSLGLLPLLGGVQRVTERAGSARGKEIALFGRRHDPRTLERW
ncbi:MAG: hypothetical protein AAGA00_16875, partial [Pseudomonadota bacterium]